MTTPEGGAGVTRPASARRVLPPALRPAVQENRQHRHEREHDGDLTCHTDFLVPRSRRPQDRRGVRWAVRLNAGQPIACETRCRAAHAVWLISLLFPLHRTGRVPMWIRRMRRRWRVKDGWHEAVYYFVMESYRDAGGTPRQRTIEALGSVPPRAYLRYWRGRLRHTRAEARRWAAEVADEVLPEERRRLKLRVDYYEAESKIARARIKWYEELQRIFVNPGDPAHRARRMERPELTVFEVATGKRAPINPLRFRKRGGGRVGARSRGVARVRRHSTHAPPLQVEERAAENHRPGAQPRVRILGRHRGGTPRTRPAFSDTHDTRERRETACLRGFGHARQDSHLRLLAPERRREGRRGVERS